MATTVLVESAQLPNEIEDLSLILGEKIGLLTSLFGCWHENVSRPFTHGSTTYRSCLHCGARTTFDPVRLVTGKRFYYPPVVKKIDLG
jgi:hypothetical protein